MNIGFQGIGQMVATFQTEDEMLTAGMAVTMTGNGTVGLGAKGSLPCGVALGVVRNGAVPVQIAGVAEVRYSGTAPRVGYAMLSGDGKGSVAVAESGGCSCLVLSLDEENNTAVIKL